MAMPTDCKLPAIQTGVTRIAQVSIAVRRAALSDIPRCVKPRGSHPPKTLPIIENHDNMAHKDEVKLDVK